MWSDLRIKEDIINRYSQIVQLNPNDTLPQVICHLCLAKVTFLDEFCTQVKHSTNLLNSLAACRDVSQTAAENEGVKVALLNSPLLSTSKTTVVPQPIAVAEVRLAAPESRTEEVTKSSTPSSSLVLSDKKVSQKPLSKTKRKTYALKHCLRCKFKTRSISGYEAHIKQECKCSTCPATFCTIRALKMHTRLAHSRKKDVLINSNNDVNDDNETSSNNVHNDNIKNDHNNGGGNDAVDANDDVDASAGADAAANVEYHWCKECDQIYLTEDDFTKHNKEFHTKQKKKDDNSSRRNSIHMTEESNENKRIVRSEDKKQKGSSSDLSSSEANDKIKIGQKRKALDTNENQDMSSNVQSKKTPQKSKLTCWKCKGIFEDYTKLFTHTCVAQQNSQEMRDKTSKTRGNYNSLSSTSGSDDERRPMRSDKKKKKRIMNSDDNSDNSDVDINLLINRHVSRVEKEEHEGRSNSDSTKSENKKINNEEEPVGSPHRVFVSDGDNNRFLSENNADEQSADENVVDIGIITLDDESDNFKKPDITPSDYNTPKQIKKKCNECGEMFSSLKALVHHKRVHKTPLSRYYSFSLQKD
ncbi:uncharacterized protein LOC142322168 isoform X2 [Lycorma delicatula]|uniref:uncharacterized protein LOC142322168 isoform X2 n=1 Tax=Lycorma delicatula TaxID=130591 RepID=UPI003F512A0D